MTSFSWNYTTVLNSLFLGVFAYLYWLYRNRDRSAAARATPSTPCAACRSR